MLQKLALGNAFTCFGADQRSSLWKILEQRVLLEPRTQLSLFSVVQEVEDSAREEGGAGFAPFRPLEAIREDYQAFGLSTQGHPMQELRQELLKTRKFPPGRSPGSRRARLKAEGSAWRAW